MHIQPWMILTWAAASAALTVALIYRATLTQHETDQLFLSDETTVSRGHREHDRILQRVRRLRPVCQGLTGATLVMSAMIAALYVTDIWPLLSFRLH